MRFAASPLMVAVALGLLGPSVLDVEEDGQEAHAPDADGSDDSARIAVEPVDAALPEADDRHGV